MKFFGPGVLWGIPLSDATGAAIANPTPVQLGTLQDVGIDFSFDEKTLHGKGQFAEDVARGKGKISIKVKNAELSGVAVNTLFLGQTAVAGQLISYDDDVGQLVAATLTLVPPNAGTFVANLGVTLAGSVAPMQRVASAPAAGQYAVDATGKYTFAAADVGKTVFIDYQYSITTGQTITVRNQAMGSTPMFRVDLVMPYKGKVATLTFPAVTCSKFGMATKLDDYMIPEMDMTAIAAPDGRVFVWSSAE